MSLLAVITVCVAIFVTFVLRRRERAVETWLRNERAKINFTFLGTKLPLESRLALRAQANKRLLSAFGIINSLTTTSPHQHRVFLSAASKVVNDSENRGNSRWTTLYRVAETFLNQEIRTTKGRITLEDCAQRLCLTVVLVDNFGIELTNIPSQTASSIAQEINRQWLLSKCDPRVTRSRTLEASLRSLGLRQAQGDSELAPEDALAIIMPQYETLWRVVLLGFVTAYHRQRRPATVARGRNVPNCLGNREQEAEAVKLAMEALRLYPSNKSIYRASPLGTGVAITATVNADVEGCHRHAQIWGADALEFRPERFDTLKSLQEEAYFPYSLGPHRCPAINGFGNRMITMLLVALGRTLSAEAGRVRFNDAGLDGDNKTPLPTGRGDVGSWVFEVAAASA
ncbi:hypothetical protein OQA88_1870 [Cercophora sp. LCS_1]